MAKKKKKETIKSKETGFDILKSIRRTWGAFNPCDRIVEDKTKYDRNREKKNTRIERDDV